LTRSGTNQFRGAATWNVRNSALDANTWDKNNDIDPRTGAWKPTSPDWHNVHTFTGSYGGPIKKNKTFFFALYDQALVNIRTTQNALGSDAMREERLSSATSTIGIMEIPFK
jgi:hypothetical protein